jgi:phage terminase large subunit
MPKITQIKEFWPAQRVAWESGPAPFLFMGGVGSGKSFVGILKLLYLLDQYPGSRAALVRQRSTQLKKTVSATLWKLLDMRHVARRNDNEGFIKLTNGSELHLRHLDKDSSIEDLKSFEINFAMIDQAEDISETAFDTLLERVGRWTGAMKRGGYPKNWEYVNELGEKIPPPYTFITAYSPGYEHWITARFWENGEEREKYRKQGYNYVIGSTRDNKALTKQYVEGRLAMGKEYVERYVDAEVWGANEGRIFDLLEDSIIEPTKDILERIRRTMRMHRVLDHGEFAPTACLWYATDSDGNVIYFREYMQEGLLVSDHRLNIYNLSKQDGAGGEPPKYYSQYADPSIFNKSRGRTLTNKPTWSVADEWSDVRIMDKQTAVWWRPSSNDELMTISRAREYLRKDPKHRNPFTGKMGAPRAYFLKRTDVYPNGCKEVLTDIRAAKREEVGMNPDGTKQYGEERDDKIRDHLLDCVRYSIGMRPALGKAQVKDDVPTGHIRLSDYEDQARQIAAAEEVERIKDWTGGKGYGY